MKRFFNILMVAVAVAITASCETKTPAPAAFEISSCTIAESAEFGTNVDFTVTAAEAANVTVTIVNEEGAAVATSTVRESAEGVFAGKLAIPYTKNIADGTYSVLVLAIGKTSDRAEKMLSINLAHPEFQSVSLVTEGTRFPLTKGEGNVWAYTGVLPAVLKGYFEAKTAEATFVFGGANLDNIELGSTEALELYEYESEIAEGTISFDVVSFAVAYPQNVKVVEVPVTTDSNYPGTVDVDFKKGQIVEFKNLGDLWVDVDFFDNNGDGTYTFRAEGGRYKLTNQANWGSLRTERLNSSNGMGEFHWDGDKITTNEAIWCLGNYYFGKPDQKPIRDGRVWSDWETYDALCMAKIDTYTYQITLRVYNYASYKFFQTKLNWGDIYGRHYDIANCNLNGLTHIGTSNGDGNFLQSLLSGGANDYDITQDPDVIVYPEEGVVIRFTFDVTNPEGIIVNAEDVTHLNLM